MRSFLMALASLIATLFVGCVPDVTNITYEGDTYYYGDDDTVSDDDDSTSDDDSADNGPGSPDFGDDDSTDQSDDDSADDDDSSDDDSADDPIISDDDTVGDDDTEEPLEDDDSADDDSAEDPNVVTSTIDSVSVWFDTLTFQPQGPMEATVGSNADFGVYVVEVVGTPGTQVNIDLLQLQIVTNDGTFPVWGQAIWVESYIEQCSILDPATRTPFASFTLDPSASTGILTFQDDIPITIGVGGVGFLPLQVNCDFRSGTTLGVEAGFAIRMNGMTIQSGGNDLNWFLYGDNGSFLNPTVQIWLQPTTPPPPIQTVTVSMTGPASPIVTRGEANAFMGALRFSQTGSYTLKMLRQLSITIWGDNDGYQGNGVSNDVVVQDHIPYCWLDMGSPISSIEAPNASGQVVFDQLSQVIGDGTEINVYCATSLHALQDGNDDGFSILMETGDILLEDANSGNAVNVEFPPGVQVLNGLPNLVYTTVIHQGQLQMYGSDTPVTGSVLSPGASRVAAEFVAISQYETVVIEEISVQIVGDLSYLDFVEIEYMNVPGFVAANTGFPDQNGIATFSAIDWPVWAGYGYTDLAVYLAISSGAPAGLEYQVILNPTGAPFEAVGQNSGFTFTNVFVTPGGPIAGYTVSTPIPIVWSRAAYSPSGASVPWTDTPVLDVHAAVPYSSGDQALASVTLDIRSTDNMASGWNRCSNTDQNTVQITKNGGVTVGMSLVLYSTNGIPCSMDPNSVVGSAEVTFTGEVIPAGNTTTYSFAYDAYGASSVADDILRVDIVETNGEVNVVNGNWIIF